MLTTLRIKNLGLVADLTLDFEPGFNVITGETGAGKSMLIGALTLVLGERADRSLIRAGADICSVEAVFQTASLRWPLAKFLEEHGLEPAAEGELILKRSIAASGANRQFINGSPTTLQALAELGEHLADLHGPHDHQSLLSPACQLDLLDEFGGHQSRRAAFAALARSRQSLLEARNSLIADDQTQAQQIDLLRHQVREIESARLRHGEEEELDAEYRRASNAARLLELAQGSLQILNGDGESLTSLSGSLGRSLQELSRLDPEARCILSLQEQAAEFLRDLQSDLSHYLDRIDLDPGRLQALEERVSLIQTLKRKYGPDIPRILAHGESAAEKLAKLEGRDAEIEKISAALAETEAELLKTGRQLSQLRTQSIPKLSKAVSRQLADLGFQRSQFDVKLDHQPALSPGTQAAISGLDTVEFQFAPNPGEPAHPLRAIASSGEMARVMLAIKTVLATVDQVPVLVFDEVDANVGGETARTVGEKMRMIGSSRQVLCITHLPQVAAAASTHFQVSKETRSGRTVTEVNRLEGEARQREISRMLGGQDAAVQKHAAALLSQQNPKPKA